MDVVENKWYEMDMSLNDAKTLLSSNIKTCPGALLLPGIT